MTIGISKEAIAAPFVLPFEFPAVAVEWGAE